LFKGKIGEIPNHLYVLLFADLFWLKVHQLAVMEHYLVSCDCCIGFGFEDTGMIMRGRDEN